MNLETINLAVIGPGYVGLPLAAEFGKKRSLVGPDLKAGKHLADSTLGSALGH